MDAKKIKEEMLFRLNLMLNALLLRLTPSLHTKLEAFAADKRGSVGMVIALIVTVAVLVIGVYILATFQASVPNITDTTANETAEAVYSAGWSALGLAVIIPIIVVASAIIGYLVSGFRGGR